ncbi:hypothetical protein L4D76_20555 [Photobacterium sagamiensis]|uniref:hypothetical protein n=1 Tax=Photobacterium sagamiensis TaxID=2910241 RepID=UPI003D0E49E0
MIMSSSFVRAQVVESTTEYHFARPKLANMTLSFNEIELSIPQGMLPEYLVKTTEIAAVMIIPPAIYLYRHFVDFRKSINGLAA